MNPINKETNASYNFVAPSIAEDAGKKIEPVFPTSELVSGEQGRRTITVKRQMTIVELGIIHSDAEVSLTADPKNLNIGAMAVVTFNTDGEHAVAINGYEVKRMSDTTTAIMFVWTGETFVPLNYGNPFIKQS